MQYGDCSQRVSRSVVTFMDDEVMTIIGTEHDMDPKWIEIAQKVHKEMHEMKEAAPDV